MTGVVLGEVVGEVLGVVFGLVIGAVVDGVDIGTLAPLVPLVEPGLLVDVGLAIGFVSNVDFVFVGVAVFTPTCGFAGIVNFVPTTRSAGSAPMTFLLAS